MVKMNFMHDFFDHEVVYHYHFLEGIRFQDYEYLKGRKKCENKRVRN